MATEETAQEVKVTTRERTKLKFRNKPNPRVTKKATVSIHSAVPGTNKGENYKRRRRSRPSFRMRRTATIILILFRASLMISEMTWKDMIC